jgi:hypothetical protein
VKKTTAAIMVVATALLCTSVFPGDARAQGVSASDKMSPEQAREKNDTHASSRLATTVQHQPHNQGGVGVVCRKKNNKPNLASDAPGFLFRVERRVFATYPGRVPSAHAKVLFVSLLLRR